MIKKMPNAVSIVVIAIIVFLGIYVFGKVVGDRTMDKSIGMDTLSLWTVYWDDEDLFTEIEDRKEEINNLSFFAAYFDSENKLFIPEATTKANKDVNETYSDRPWSHYLTIVNDKIKEDGTSSLKDTELLEALFSSEEVMDNHIAEIINMTLEGNYDGVEIDYEAIRKDTELWEKFIVFSTKLYEQTNKNGLGLRIILEPSAPMDTMKFPDGPQYAIMCYNLYGYGTDPGPKANPEFLEELVNKAKSLPGETEFILATGGFTWSDSGKAKAITTQEAEETLQNSGVKTNRDKESQYVYYNYKDENGEGHTVWYADDKTIEHLVKTLEDLKVKKYGIWRIGA